MLCIQKQKLVNENLLAIGLIHTWILTHTLESVRIVERIEKEKEKVKCEKRGNVWILVYARTCIISLIQY